MLPTIFTFQTGTPFTSLQAGELACLIPIEPTIEGAETLGELLQLIDEEGATYTTKAVGRTKKPPREVIYTMHVSWFAPPISDRSPIVELAIRSAQATYCLHSYGVAARKGSLELDLTFTSIAEAQRIAKIISLTWHVSVRVKRMSPYTVVTFPFEPPHRLHQTSIRVWPANTPLATAGLTGV